MIPIPCQELATKKTDVFLKFPQFVSDHLLQRSFYMFIKILKICNSLLKFDQFFKSCVKNHKKEVIALNSPLTPQSLFDLEHTDAKELLLSVSYPWEILPKLKDFIRSLQKTLDKNEYREVSDGVFIHKTASVAPSAVIDGPTVIGDGTEVRPGAFIRGSTLIGKGCVIGNSTEIKNAVISDGVQIPHYNYVGDSILGYQSHMGAGSIASNFRSDKGNITVHGERDIETGLRKLGVMLGDFAEVGCNSVLCPGSVVGRNSIVYPLSRVRGVLPENVILKDGGRIVKREER